MTPPLLARWVLARLLPAADRDFFLGDLAEEYAEHAETEGIAAARRWYRRQAIHSLPPLARRRLTPSALSPRQIGGGSMWRDLVDDLQYALRLTRRGPLVALVVITTMVLGIGVTAAMFSVVNGVLLKPLPFADSERVVRIGSTFRDRKISSAYPDLVDIRRIVRGFEAVSATSFDEMTLQHGPDPRLIQLARVDQDYARVFSIRPLAGRLFDSRDVQPGAPKVVVLSYDFWRQEFGSDHAIVGQAITLNNESHQVVGILPRQAFAFPTNGFLALVPLIAVPGTSMERRGSMWITAAAKLRPGVSSDRAREELGQAAAQIARDNPATNEVIGAWLTPLREFVVGDVGSMLLLLAASVAAVLLIACANIANLLLGQSTARAREFAVRSAIGGGTGRIVRQVLTESMLLAAIGGGLGMLLAPVLTRAILAGYPGELPRVGEVGVDARVLGVAVVVTLFAGLLAGIPTAQRAVVRDLSRAIRDGGRTGARRSRSGYVLIAAQVAASLTLVFAAALLLKTLSRLFRTDPGFDPRGVVTFQVALSAARHRDGEAINRFYGDFTARLATLPGVNSVATVTKVPFGGGDWGDVIVDETQGDRGPDNPHVQVVWASPRYLETLGMTLARGRSLDSTDLASTTPVLLVNEALARQVYPGQDPIGRRVQWNGRLGWQIVGVTKSIHVESLYDDPTPTIVVPLSQMPRRTRYVAIRTSLPLEQVLVEARSILRTIDPTVAITEPATMEERLGATLAAHRFRAVLVGGFGVLALVLSLIGIYGVVAYAVSGQTREIGIRMALGEDRSRIRVRIVTGALRIALIGTAFGAAGALGAGKWLSTFLVGVDPSDPAVLFLAGGVILAVAGVAAYLPARRASEVDPLAALRAE